MNKISPQGDANGNAAAGSKALPGGEGGSALKGFQALKCNLHLAMDPETLL